MNSNQTKTVQLSHPREDQRSSMIDLTPDELIAVIFAVKADLQIVENDIEEFIGQDEVLLSALQKLENYGN